MNCWLDICIAKSTADALAEGSKSYFCFVLKLAKYIFKKEGAQYFSQTGTIKAPNGMDTLALPAGYVDGFLGEIDSLTEI
jgi:hypothetical protein